MITAARGAWFTAGAATALVAVAAASAWGAFEIGTRIHRLCGRMRMTAQERAADDQLCDELEAEYARIRAAQQHDTEKNRETARKGFRPDLLTVSALRPEDLTVVELVAELRAADEHAAIALAGRHSGTSEFSTFTAEYEMWSDHAMSLFGEALRRRYRTWLSRSAPLSRADRLRLDIATTCRLLGPDTTDSRADETL